MYSYSSVTISPTAEITVDMLNQMVLNDAANETMRLLSLEPPLAVGSMDTNTGTASVTPSPGTSTNALYFANVETTGVTLNIDNVINAPLSLEVSVDRAGIYRFYVVAIMSSSSGDCIPSFQITDIDSDFVQEIGGYITSGTQSSTTGHHHTPSILFVDRWLYAGKTYKFTVTTGLLGTNADISYINAYKFPPTIAYFWIQGYNGTGLQMEVSNLTIPSFGIQIPDFEIPEIPLVDIPIPDIIIPDIEVPLEPPFDFGGGIGGDFGDFNPDFPFDFTLFDDDLIDLANYDLISYTAATFNSTDFTTWRYHDVSSMITSGLDSAATMGLTKVVDYGSPSGGSTDGEPPLGQQLTLLSDAITNSDIWTIPQLDNSFLEGTIGDVTVSNAGALPLGAGFFFYLGAKPTVSPELAGNYFIRGFVKYAFSSPYTWTAGLVIDLTGTPAGGGGISTSQVRVIPDIFAGDVVRIQFKNRKVKLYVNGTRHITIDLTQPGFTWAPGTRLRGAFRLDYAVASQHGTHADNPVTTNYDPGSDIALSRIKMGGTG